MWIWGTKFPEWSNSSHSAMTIMRPCLIQVLSKITGQSIKRLSLRCRRCLAGVHSMKLTSSWWKEGKRSSLNRSESSRAEFRSSNSSFNYASLFGRFTTTLRQTNSTSLPMSCCLRSTINTLSAQTSLSSLRLIMPKWQRLTHSFLLSFFYWSASRLWGTLVGLCAMKRRMISIDLSHGRCCCVFCRVLTSVELRPRCPTSSTKSRSGVRMIDFY